MGLRLRDEKRHTYQDYLTWSDEKRYELIHGFAYAMSPAPSIAHQDVVGEIYRQVANALENTKSSCRVFVAPLDVRLPSGIENEQTTDTVVQPDVSMVCDPTKIDQRGVRGAPDWIVEVLSPATASHDSMLKRDLYEQHGVKEYWLVHPIDRLVTIYHLNNGVYGKPQLYELDGNTSLLIYPAITVNWQRVTKYLAKQ